MRTVAKNMPGYLRAAYAAETSGVNSQQMYDQILASLPSAVFATYLARTVQLPKRVVGVGPLIRRENGAFESPGYAPNIGRVEVTFIHELAQNYSGSSIWALLTVWRALARAGTGLDFPNTSDLSFGLTAGGAAGGSGSGLNSPYRQDFTVTLVSPDPDPTDTGTSLVEGPGYVVKNAWPAEFGLETLSYDNGKSIMELKASFQCDDVLPFVYILPPPLRTSNNLTYGYADTSNFTSQKL